MQCFVDMTLPFDVTTVWIATRETDKWINRFSALFSQEVTRGVLMRGFSDPGFWLKPAPVAEVSDEAVRRLEETAKEIPTDILKTLNGYLTHLYVVNELDVFRAFVWASLHYDELPLVFFPTNCSEDDIWAVLSAVDTLGLSSYPSVHADIPWFVTVNAVGPDDMLACLASRTVEMTKALREEFRKDVIEDDRLNRYR